ncbi:MAG: cation:dicarboxylate symporter family transporter [Coraliomargarita sp.]
MGKLKFSLTTQIVIGMVLGILVGLFFGEVTANLEFIGIAYVRLLQMTILPYIMFSLMVGFGSLSYERAWLLAKRAGLLLLVFWGIGLTIVVLMATTFPDRQSATFFNPGMVQEAADVSLVEMFVPSNPFEALATSAIPAVVLFSILFGLALIAIPKKEAVLDVFTVMSKTLQRVTGFVVKITPIGVFGLTAAAAGTLDGDDVIRLQVYFVAYIGCCMFLTFVAFPLVMSMLTPFTYKQVVTVSRNALITAFTTGNLFVVLPILIEDCQKMFKEKCPDAEDANFFIDILIPVTFNFPNMGKLTALLFIFFGAWFIGSPMPYEHYPQTVATALPVFFGGIDIAVPYMLQIEGLPTDLFSLYILSGIINGRFATLLACMELLCFTLVAVSSLLGLLRINLKKILIGVAVLLVGGLAMMGSARLLLENLVPTANEQAEFVQNMRVDGEVLARVFKEPPVLPSTAVADGTEAMATKKEKPRKGFFARAFGGSKSDGELVDPTGTIKADGAAGSVRQRNVLRVGFFPDNLPWSYFNGKGELAGYDIEAAHRLASHLGCQLEFYPLKQADAHRYLDAGEIDIVMSGVAITTTNISRYTFSNFYLQLYLAVLLPKDPIVEDAFSSLDKLKESEGIVVGYVPPSPFLPNIRAMLPNLELVEYESYSDFFAAGADAEHKEVLYTSAEAGSAMTLMHPEYKVQLTRNRTVYNLAYPINPNDKDFLVFMNQWLALEEQSNASDESYDYWILGNPREDQTPRWSIIRDVLGWVK